MPQIIEVPGHGQVEFPDEMSDQQIVAAIQKNSPQQHRPNAAAMNPEAQVGPFTVKGETSGGFNPAAAIIKAGDIADSLRAGVVQMQRGPADWIRQKFGMGRDPVMEHIDQQRAESRQPMQDLAEVHPGSTTAAEVGMAAVSPNKLAPLFAAAEYGSPQERLLRGGAALAGNKAGELVGKGVGRVAQPVRPGELSQTQTLANEAADRLGVKLSAGEATGNRALKFAESATADLPLASGISSARHQANSKALNRAANRQLGQQGDEVTETVLAQARNDISGEYKRILDPAKIELDNSFRSEVQAISGSKVMKELRDEETDALLDQFRNMPQGKISVSGEWFQQNKTALDSQIKAAYNNGQPGKARALEQFEKALDRAALRSLSTADQAAYKQAGKQWATLRTLEAGKVVENGNVMPGRLDTYFTNRYKGAYKEGKIKGDLPDVARLANTLRSPPNSGTVPRAFYTGSIGGAAMAEPMTAAGMLFGPALFQKASTSELAKKYITRGLMDISPEDEKLLMLAGGKLGLLGMASADR